jgi:hypothetical protein
MDLPPPMQPLAAPGAPANSSSSSSSGSSSDSDSTDSEEERRKAEEEAAKRRKEEKLRKKAEKLATKEKKKSSKKDKKSKKKEKKSSSDSDDSESRDHPQYSKRPHPSQLVFCGTSTSKSNPRSNSAADLSRRACLNVDICKLAQCRCYDNCKRKCIDRVRLTAVAKLRYFVWYEREGKERAQSDRHDAIYDLVKRAHQHYLTSSHGNDPPEQRFSFMVGEQEVCELSFQQMIGIIPSKAKCTWQGWTKMKNKMLGIDVPILPTPKPPRNKKTMTCKAFIHQSCDTLIGDSTSLARYGEYTYLPYRRMDHYFASYQHYCEKHNIPDNRIARFRTFTLAFTAVEEELKIKLQTDAGECYTSMM